MKNILSEFMNHIDEWHSFVIGLSEGFCFRRASFFPLHFRKGSGIDVIDKEYWYYGFGRVVGTVCKWIFITTLIVIVIKVLGG